MLTYFQEKDLVRISDQRPANWEEAIRISCDNLIEKEIAKCKCNLATR